MMLEQHSNFGSGTRAATSGSASGMDAGWKRLPFWRTFLRMLIPLTILLVVNLSLYTAIHFSTPETYESFAYWYRFVDANLERSIPTWVNSTVWALSALVSGYIAYHTTIFRTSWWLFTCVTVLLSIDEAVSLHERLEPLAEELGTGLRFAWVIPGMIITGTVVLLLLRMVLSLPALSRNGLIIGGILFLTGSVGVETITGFVYARSGADGVYALLSTVEEGFEILGVTVCLVSLLHLIEYRRHDTGVAYRLALSRAPGRSGR